MARRKRNNATVPAHAPDTSWHFIFLDALAETGTVTAASKVAGVDRVTAYRHRDAFPEFEAAWESSVENKVDEAVETLIDIGIKDRNVHALLSYIRSRRPEYRTDSQVAVQVNNIMSPEEEQEQSAALMADVDAMTARMIEHRVIEEGDEEDS